MTRIVIFLTLAVTTVAFVDNSAFAQTQRREGGGGNAAAVQEALAKVQMTVRQLEGEKTALSAENEKLKSETKRLKAEITSLNKKLMGVDKNLINSQDTLNKFEDANSELANRLRQHQTRTQELVEKFKETVRTLQRIEGENAQFQATIASQKTDIQTCTAKNETLFKAGMDVLKEYEEKGVWDALLQREPVTQIKKVEAENIAQELKIKLEDQKIGSLISQ